MTRLILASLLAASALLAPGFARAHVDVQIHVGLPAAPALVVVQPGVRVVENFDEEVFVTRGWYWCRRPHGWYRARAPHAAFVYVEPRRVPAALVKLPPGHYRHWHKEQAKAERKRWKAEEKRWKAHEKAERKYEKAAHHQNGHGHGRD